MELIEARKTIISKWEQSTLQEEIGILSNSENRVTILRKKILEGVL